MNWHSRKPHVPQFSALGTLSPPVSSNDIPKAFDITEIVHDTTESGAGVGDVRKLWTERISWEPRAFISHNFLSKDECGYLINLAMPHMKKSTVIGSQTGQIFDSRVRTSSVTFLERGKDVIIRDIEKRIADLTFIPVENGEELQILHYEVGQKYEMHYDYFLDNFNTRNGGQRIVTIIMYLSDVEGGGETIFPHAKENSSSVPRFDGLSGCGGKVLSVRPKMGDALLFWNKKPDATLDLSSLHGGCPVTSGNKWTSTKWLRESEYKV